MEEEREEKGQRNNGKEDEGREGGEGKKKGKTPTKDKGREEGEGATEQWEGK